jgi:hypothetical protein
MSGFFISKSVGSLLTKALGNEKTANEVSRVVFSIVRPKEHNA